MKVGVLGYDHCLGGELFGFADVLHLANRIAQTSRPGEPKPFEITVIGARGPVIESANGARISTERPPTDLDLLVIPGFDFGDMGGLDGWLAAMGPELAMMRRAPRVASICVGAFLLGAAGRLDGRACTTAWLFAAELARRHPKARVQPEALLVEDRGVTTSGAFSASQDLALKIVREDAGEGLARAIGKVTLIGANRTSQAPYVDAAMLADLHAPFARAVRQRFERDLAQPYDLTALADAFHMSSRTFLRRFKAETGRTPLEDLQALRVGRAKRLLETTPLGLAEVAVEVGYQDLSTFGRLFARVAEMSPAAYRKRFRATP